MSGTVYTDGNVRTDELKAGDFIDIAWARVWGQIMEIYPYRCGPKCVNDGHGPEGTCEPHRGDRVARFANGVECTLEPGGTMFPS